MFKHKTVRKNQSKEEAFLESIRGAVEAEHHLGRCCFHLSLLIKNGTVRSRFEELSRAAKDTENKLSNILLREGQPYALKCECKFCRLNPDNFSLEGAINLALEIVEAAINYYRVLVGVADGGDRLLFTSLLKDKIKHRRALLKEREFHHSSGKGGIINDFCIPHIISRLWH